MIGSLLKTGMIEHLPNPVIDYGQFQKITTYATGQFRLTLRAYNIP
jgi:hypothetical protein